MLFINSGIEYGMMMPEEQEEKVPDGRKTHEDIFALENSFDNGGFKQGAKFNLEQRLKTVRY